MKKEKKIVITDIAVCILGCAVYSLAVVMFVKANKLSPGGLTGVSALLNYLTGVPSGIILLVLNIPIIILGYVKLGYKLIIKSAVATLILSLSLDLAEFLLPEYKTDSILASLFGGILMGAGLSFIFLRGATTGGVDIIAKVINMRYRHISIGRCILFMDGAVILLAALVYGNIESALYSAIALFVSSKTVDVIIYGADKGKIIYVLTDYPSGICKAVNENLKRGITRINAIGGYSGKDKTMLICTVRQNEVAGVLSVINKNDPNAFIIVAEAGEIIGEGFKPIEKRG
ncbi:MAG: YitT family protein [Clostridia bacterium]|nr:YitT family protein [Clostridia bacterium]